MLRSRPELHPPTSFVLEVRVLKTGGNPRRRCSLKAVATSPRSRSQLWLLVSFVKDTLRLLPSTYLPSSAYELTINKEGEGGRVCGAMVVWRQCTGCGGMQVWDYDLRVLASLLPCATGR